MKKILKYLFLLAPLNVYSQDSLLNYFLVNETSRQTILLNWEIKSGNTCNGIEIFRSTDGNHYYYLNEISGICGSSSSAISYQFEDENPVSNSTNYYKIKLGSGEPGTAVSQFFISVDKNSYLLYPNPADNQVKIHFENQDQSEVTFQLMNISGQIVLTERANTDFLEPDLTNFSSGVYIFSIEINQKVIQGRFMKN
jgi:cyclophilin family peptidyl-prolyl cis-trans isomerase